VPRSARDELDALLDLAVAGCAQLTQIQLEALKLVSAEQVPAGTVPRLLLATRNAKKLNELRRILAPLVEVEVVGLDDVDPYDEVPETGATFAANALLKAARGGGACGVDHSGRRLGPCGWMRFNGMPGILSARWSGRHGDDEANLRLVLAQVADVADQRLSAAFVCAAALVVPVASSRSPKLGCRGG